MTKLVLERLESSYGRPEWHPSGDPVGELVQTILSQHTSDINSERAFRQLRERFPSWESVRDAPHEAVVEAIRCGGLAEGKAQRLQQALAAVLAADEKPPLASLSTLPLDAAKKRLTSLPGVGPKTAACVLLFAVGRPALPVDTHVYRVAGRIGLIGPGVSPEQAHEWLEGLLDSEDVYSFHVCLITHGRRICHSRSPECSRCVVNDLCQYYATGNGRR